MRRYDEEALAGLLKALPPPPEGWVEAAQELPRARARLDTLVARAEAHTAFRAAVLADLEAALEEAGIGPSPRTLDELRRRLE